MQRGSTGHMLFVIAAGLVSLAVCTAIGVALIRFANYALGGTLTAILLAVLFVVWLREWWKRKTANYEDYASANELEYLEELADEHERGVKDRAEQLRFLLPRFGERNPKAREQYKNRLDSVQRVIDNSLSDDALRAKLQKEIQPEMDRMQAEHERFMRLIAQMPEPSEAQKRAIAEANSPAGWQRAIREVIAENDPNAEQSKQPSSDPSGPAKA